MEIKKEYSFEDLKNECWGGADYILKWVEDNGVEDTFMDYLQTAIFCDDIPTLTEVNDFLRFEDDYIKESMQPFTEEEEEGEN